MNLVPLPREQVIELNETKVIRRDRELGERRAPERGTDALVKISRYLHLLSEPKIYDFKETHHHAPLDFPS